MASLNSRKTAAPKAAQSVSDLIVKRSQRKAKAAPMLTEDIVPPGKYRSEVIAVTDAKSDAGKLMADVTYRFTDKGGETVEARIRYPATGYHIERLFDALIDAGLPENSPLVDAVGIQERVEVAYPYNGALGKIKARSPVEAATPVSKPKNRSTLVKEDDTDDDIEFDEDEFLVVDD